MEPRRHSFSWVSASAAIAILALGCGAERGSEPQPGAKPTTRAPNAAASASSAPTSADPATRPTPAAPPNAVTPGDASRPTVVFLGDSLTAGYGLAAEDAYPAVVERLLEERGQPIRAVNAGVSGDTTAGGLARLDWLLAQKPELLFVCLGGNDGLRGLPLEATEANLRTIVERTKEAGVRVVLAGIQIPPNYGPEYTEGFRSIFPRLARETGVELLPFLLEGVAADPKLNQPDGIHPNVAGQRIVAHTVTDKLAPLVAELGR